MYHSAHVRHKFPHACRSASHSSPSGHLSLGPWARFRFRRFRAASSRARRCAAVCVCCPPPPRTGCRCIIGRRTSRANDERPNTGAHRNQSIHFGRFRDESSRMRPKLHSEILCICTNSIWRGIRCPRETRLESTHLFYKINRHISTRERRHRSMVSPIGTPTKEERGRRAEDDERAKTRRGRRLFIWHAVVAVVGAFATTAGGQHKAGRR